MMIPFPGIDRVQGLVDRDGDEHQSSSTESSSATSTSDKLSALPQGSTSSPSPRRTTTNRISINTNVNNNTNPNSNTNSNAHPTSTLNPSTKRLYHRRSLDGSLLNFPSFLVSASDHRTNPNSNPNSTPNPNPNPDSNPNPNPHVRVCVSEGNSPTRGRANTTSSSSIIGRGQAFVRPRTGSDPPPPPPIGFRSSGNSNSNNHHHYRKHLRSPSPSNSRSRAVSPLRFIQSISNSFHGRHNSNQHTEREEPFVPINPFKSKISFDITSCSCFHRKRPTTTPDIELAPTSITSSSFSGSGAEVCDDVLRISSIKDFCDHLHIFVADVLPRYIYLNFLLRLPALYFTRVARIFMEAEVSRPDVERMIESGSSGMNGTPQEEYQPQYFHMPATTPVSAPQPQHVDGKELGHGNGYRYSTLEHIRTSAGVELATQIGMVPALTSGHIHIPGRNAQQNHQQEDNSIPVTPPIVTLTPRVLRFKRSWEAFIDSLLREWKTLNVVSALLCSAILTIFQIPSAEADPITRTAAILSLICALMSLTYGCMFIVRFGTMRSMIRASKWAQEARRTNTAILWNVWVLLAMPAVWLAWSMIIFIFSILSYVWRTGSEIDPETRPRLSRTQILGPRIAITFTVFVGLIYLMLILKTLKRYGMHGGSSHNIFSPQARLGEIIPVNNGNGNGNGKISQLVGDHQSAIPVDKNEHSHSAKVLGVDAAFERRGRERHRSISVGRNGRRREEPPPEPRSRNTSRPRRSGFGVRLLPEDNRLGLYPGSSASSPDVLG